MADRFLSGVQPSGELHLGNYFGAMRAHIANQDDAYYFIADYHALTSLRDAPTLRQNVKHIAASYLALGLDPERAVLYRQSDVPEVTELMWLLSTVTGMGLLERAHSYKDKVNNGIKPTMGLFTYPVLMAADILAFDADVVPVGSDQLQHLEMTRDMATSFNAVYGEVFKLPRFVLGTPVPVPGDDGRKMSKSYGNTIPIFLRGKALKSKVMGIKTDSTPLEDAKDTSTCSVFALYSLIADAAQIEQMKANYAGGGYGYGHAKKALLELIKAHFAEAYTRYDALMADETMLEEILLAGAEKARAQARAVLNRARLACGLD